MTSTQTADRPLARPRTLVVIPTYDEAANVTAVVERVRHAVTALDILVVDDSSPDGTADTKIQRAIVRHAGFGVAACD